MVLVFYCSITDHIANNETDSYILAHTTFDDGCPKYKSKYIYVYVKNETGQYTRPSLYFVDMKPLV